MAGFCRSGDPVIIVSSNIRTSRERLLSEVPRARCWISSCLTEFLNKPGGENKSECMETIKVEVHWCEKNYACAVDIPGFASVVVTNKSLDGLKQNFEESLKWTIEDSLEEGESVPYYLMKGDYRVEYSLAVSALLRSAENYTTMAVLSRVTGINQRQLSNYASEVKIPRPAQRDKIISGLREIGKGISALC